MSRERWTGEKGGRERLKIWPAMKSKRRWKTEGKDGEKEDGEKQK